MDTGPELNRIYSITPGLSRGVRRVTGFLVIAGGIDIWREYYVRLNYVSDSDYGVSSDGGV